MSREGDDARLYSCYKKYEEIVKQVLLLDELTDSMDPPSSRMPNCKNNSRGNSNGTNRESFDQVIVQTITKFLHDLNSTTVDSNPKPSDHQ